MLNCNHVSTEDCYCYYIQLICSRADMGPLESSFVSAVHVVRLISNACLTTICNITRSHLYSPDVKFATAIKCACNISHQIAKHFVLTMI